MRRYECQLRVIHIDHPASETSGLTPDSGLAAALRQPTQWATTRHSDMNGLHSILICQAEWFIRVECAARPEKVARPQCAPCRVRLLKPGIPGEPFVRGAAVRAKAAGEEHSAAAKAIPVRIDAGRDSSSRVRTLDHDHTH